MNLFRFFISRAFWFNLFLALLIFAGLFYLGSKWIFTYTHHGESVQVPDLSKVDIDKAQRILRDKDLAFEIDSSRFDSTRAPFSILDYYPKAGTVVKVGRKIYIKSNPRTWREVPFPDILMKSKRIAFSKLMINNLQVGDTIYKKSVSKDVVLMAMYKNRQLSKGDKLPRYAKVDLVIGAGLEKNVNAPSFLNLSLNAAKQLIKQHYFELGNIEYERPSDSLLAASGDPRVRVVYQDPPPGSLTDEGVPVSLWLSSKPKEELTTYIESLDAIYNQHMEVDTIEVYKSSPSTVTEIIPQTQPQTYTVPRQNKPRPVNPRPNEGGGSSAPPSTGQESSGQGVEPQVPAPPPAAPVPLPSGGEGVEMD